MTNSIASVSTCSFSGMLPSIDREEQEIIERLRAYGVSPTGDKTTDKAKLRDIELKEAQEENVVTNKFLTVSTGEQQRIQEKKKENRRIANPDSDKRNQDKRVGAKLLGDQIYFAIKINTTGSAIDPKEKDKYKIEGDYTLSKHNSFNQQKG